MAAERKLPDNQTLMHWVEDEHLTHQQIAERVFATTGHQVGRSAISAALSRAGLSKNLPRHSDVLPWRVKSEHIREHPARMLRVLARQRSGAEVKDYELKRLEGFLAKLEAEHAVVAYDPQSQYGFYYVEKRDGIDALDGIPIRRESVKISGK